jgi:hypothetical protein
MNIQSKINKMGASEGIKREIKGQWGFFLTESGEYTLFLKKLALAQRISRTPLACAK